MGSFDVWHWIVLLFILGVPAAIIGLIVWLVVRASRRPVSAAGAAAPPVGPAGSPSSAESRLQELASLRARGLITESEYGQRRTAILDGI
ncbi:SHOCT domain-containing protein [Luteimonas sp. SJ-92]|uniref:SHOCT domain-containing protein n=1 Tax=Luteimonas salinisoli TaxID=2752307 RepID=A0A853JH82_9GAMM|nr:SHOCT domain-containing protein [Luteimonas salinisoli]NZA27800.1 SHOCT domain-containing protein [Luteimonas salinisoli]